MENDFSLSLVAAKNSLLILKKNSPHFSAANRSARQYMEAIYEPFEAFEYFTFSAKCRIGYTEYIICDSNMINETTYHP